MVCACTVGRGTIIAQVGNNGTNEQSKQNPTLLVILPKLKHPLIALNIHLYKPPTQHAYKFSTPIAQKANSSKPEPQIL